MRRLLAGAGDRLSPIVVKELRQGVRGNVFTGAFLLLVLAVLVILSLSLLVDGRSREGFAFGFWFFVSIPLLIILPLGAGVAIAGEVAGNTLEPLLLTRLTAWRVVAGKWSATASQVLVMAVALLPFVLVRYYLGMVEITSDVALLAAFTAWSLLLAGITVAIAAARMSGLLRALLVIVLGIALLVLFVVVLEQMSPGRRLGGGFGSLAGLAVLALITLLSALEAGALQIAPAALYQPARLRLLALLAFGVAAWSAVSPSATPFGAQVVFWGVALGTGVALAGLCEAAPPLPSRYAPFYRARWRAPLRYVLAPGWPAGVGFALLVALGIAGAVALYGEPGDALVALGGILGTAFLPVAVGRTFFPRGRQLLVMAVVTFVSVCMSSVAAIALDAGADSAWRAGRVLLPLCPGAYALAALGVFGTRDTANVAGLPISMDVAFAGVVLAVVGVTLFQAAKAWRQIGRLMARRAAP